MKVTLLNPWPERTVSVVGLFDTISMSFVVPCHNFYYAPALRLTRIPDGGNPCQNMHEITRRIEGAPKHSNGEYASVES
jgi:hypothetical protein